MKMQNLWSAWIGELTVHVNTIRAEAVYDEIDTSTIIFLGRLKQIRILLDALIDQVEKSQAKESQ